MATENLGRVVGFAGWTRVTDFEDYGDKQLEKVTDYIGGEGTKPTANIGLYFAIGGGFTSDKDLAKDRRGKAGTGGGDVEDYTIHAWGDSMTDGTGSTGNGNYPYQLGDILGKKVIKHGFPGYTSTQIKDEFVAYYTANPLEKQNPAIIWVGRNNYYPSSATVKTDVAAMIAVLGHDRYLILGLTNSNPAEQIGNDGYDVINAYNVEMQTLYKTNFIDIRKELVLNYNSTIPQDVTDFGLDLPPSSLLSDNIHLNNAGYLVVAKRVAKSSDVLYGQGNKFSGSLKILQDDKLPKGRGIELNTIGDTGYLSNYDRVKNLVEKLSIQYNAGSELRLLENGGTLKIGTLASYVSGALFIPVIDISTREVKQAGLGSIIPNITTNSISVTNGANKVIGSDVILDLTDNIIINRGIIINGDSYHIPPSSTRAIFQLSGSTDRFLIFGAGDAYVYSAATITQFLSVPDLQFVVGGVEAMRIDTSQQVTVEKAPVTAKGVVRKTELDLKQDTLVSATNIKTINGASILGSGDIAISGGGGGSTTDASLLTSGTLADDRLSANVPILETVGPNKVIKKENLRVVAWGAGIEDFTDVNGESSGKISTSWLDTYASSKGWGNALATALTGFVAETTYLALSATDTILQAFQKIQGMLVTKANIDSQAFTGNPTVPTQTAGNNTTRIASTAFVKVAADAKVQNSLTASTVLAPSVTAVNTALGLKANIAAATGTLIALTFLSDSVQGTVASPLTGNITGVTTGAQLGVVTLVIHNHTTAPTFDAKYKKLSGSGNYTTGVINYIFCEYINATEIIYSINQRT